MTLHEDAEGFLAAIDATAEHLGIRNIHVEKDYWLTRALKNLAASEMAPCVVFKGGTSLSKAFRLIERFSEDVDLALVHEPGRSGNETKRLLRQLTGIAGAGLEEDDGERHGSIRRIYYTYPHRVRAADRGQVSERLLIEANAFANPIPYEQREITTYIHDFLHETSQHGLIERFALQPFMFNVLCLERTLAEKIMTLVKASYNADPYDELQRKVRHIYDIHQMLCRGDLVAFLHSDALFAMLDNVRDDDAKAHVGDKAWLQHPLKACLLFSDTASCWNRIRAVYHAVFRDMVYAATMPDDEAVVATLEVIRLRLEEYPDV